MTRRSERVIWAASSAVIALALILSFSHFVTKAYRNRAEADTKNIVKTAVTPLPEMKAAAPLPEQIVSPSELSNTFRAVAKLMKPAVVHISTVQKVKASPLGQGFPNIPGFEFQLPQMPRQHKQRGTGSGFIVTADGFILTNNHVVGKADEIEVKLEDGRKFKGKVIGTDEYTDLAVVKIDAANLPVASLGNSDAMEQGDWVVALGSPFGLEQTITAGIISAKGRHVGNSPYNNFIQTDASINPGNSGGPLVNMRGEVIGINTMIFSESGGNQGIGFAIPSNMARNVYDQIATKGKVIRGYLGVNISDLTPEKAKAFGLDVNEGALVEDVMPDTPAAKAGLQSGDVVVSFDGKPVKNRLELTNSVAQTPVGKRAEVKFIRDGQVQTRYVETAERKLGLNANPELGGEEEGEESSSSGGKLGFSASTLTEQQAANLKIKSGVVIDRVVPGSPAAEAGLQRGDVIHQVNRQPIRSAADLAAVVKSLNSGDTVMLQVERKGQGLNFVPLTIE